MVGPIGGSFGIPPVNKGTSEKTSSGTAGSTPVAKAPAPEGTAAQKKSGQTTGKTESGATTGGMAVSKAASPAPAAKRSSSPAGSSGSSGMGPLNTSSMGPLNTPGMGPLGTPGMGPLGTPGMGPSSGLPETRRTAKQLGRQTADEILESQERLAELRSKPSLTAAEQAERDELIEAGTDARPARSRGPNSPGPFTRGPGRTSAEIEAGQDRIDELRKKPSLSKKERAELEELDRNFGGARIRSAPEGARTSDQINEESRGRSGMSISQGKTIDGDPNSPTYGQEVQAELKGVGPSSGPNYKAFPVDVEADAAKFGQIAAQLKPGAKVSKKTLDEFQLRTEWPFIEATQKKTGKVDYANEEEYVQKKLSKTGATRPYIGQQAAETVELPSNFNFYYSLAQSRRNLASQYASRGIDLPEEPARPAKEARKAVESKPPAPTAADYGLPATKGSVSPRDIDLVTAKETFRSLQAYERERIPPSAWKYTSESDYIADYLKNRSYDKASKVPVESGDKLLDRIRANVRNLMAAYYGPEATDAYAAPAGDE